jgi:hypothetical protein
MQVDISTKAAEWMRDRDQSAMLHLIPPLG